MGCAEFPEAIIAVDVAILNWIFKYVKGNVGLRIDFDVIKSVCFLSVHPDISVNCEVEIISVLEIFSINKNFASDERRSLNFLC